MNTFDLEHARQLRRSRKYDELVEYCSNYPSDASALAQLAVCYYNGDGVTQDYEMSFHLDSESANMGYPDGIALLGHDYIYGHGTKKDEKKGNSIT